MKTKKLSNKKKTKKEVSLRKISGKPVKELKNSKLVESIKSKKGWYKINLPGFDTIYSERYCVIPNEIISEFLKKFPHVDLKDKEAIKNFLVEAKIINSKEKGEFIIYHFSGYFYSKIVQDSKIVLLKNGYKVSEKYNHNNSTHYYVSQILSKKQDKEHDNERRHVFIDGFGFRIGNSQDKTRKFDIYLSQVTLKVDFYLRIITVSVYPFLRIYEKKHVGKIDLENIFKSMVKISNKSLANLNLLFKEKISLAELLGLLENTTKSKKNLQLFDYIRYKLSRYDYDLRGKRRFFSALSILLKFIGDKNAMYLSSIIDKAIRKSGLIKDYLKVINL